MTRQEIVEKLERDYGYSFTKEGEFGHEFDWICELMEDVQNLVKESDSLPCVRDRLNDFLSKQQDIPDEIQKVINEKFWEMI